MDIDMEEGEITIRLRGDRHEFADLYEDLRRWHSASESPYTRRMLNVLREAGGVRDGD